MCSSRFFWIPALVLSAAVCAADPGGVYGGPPNGSAGPEFGFGVPAYGGRGPAYGFGAPQLKAEVRVMGSEPLRL